MGQIDLPQNLPLKLQFMFKLLFEMAVTNFVRMNRTWELSQADVVFTVSTSCVRLNINGDAYVDTIDVQEM